MKNFLKKLYNSFSDWQATRFYNKRKNRPSIVQFGEEEYYGLNLSNEIGHN